MGELAAKALLAGTGWLRGEPAWMVEALLSCAELQAIGTRHPELYRRLGGLSEQSMQTIAARIVGDLLLPSGERRIAAVLARVSGNQAIPVTMRLSQAVVGQMSNTSRDRVNRALQRFRKAGWVDLRYQTIIIRNPAALKHFARVGE